MSMESRKGLMKVSALALGLSFALAAQAQEASTGAPPADQEQATKTPGELDTVQVLGSRARGRTAAETAAPVDIITSEQLRQAGVQEVGQILQMLEPSFNFSRTFVSDGTDILRPATLRALGPDQVLVLVNGKRRHQQALVNVQQTIGRGSAGTDINAIPISAIDRIEVLRDGASAQYGSDAISGVINIVLRQQTDVTLMNFEVGQTYEGDGRRAARRRQHAAGRSATAASSTSPANIATARKPTAPDPTCCASTRRASRNASAMRTRRTCTCG